MTVLDNGEAQERYGEPEFIAYDEPANAKEIVYPNTWATRPNSPSGLPESVEEANPALFLNPDDVKRTYIDARTQTVGVPANGAPFRLIARNPRRVRITIWTDATNTVPVFLSAQQGSPLGGVGSGAVSIAPASLPLKLTATSEFYVSATALSTIFFIEEATVSER